MPHYHITLQIVAAIGTEYTIAADSLEAAERNARKRAEKEYLDGVLGFPELDEVCVNSGYEVDNPLDK